MTIPPTHEQERIKALRRYHILDTPPDGSFDTITELASELLQVPVAIVSLVDTDRIWFKSGHGIDAKQADRVPGLCSSVIMNDAPYILEDASIDPRSLSNPLVAREHGFRFYAGVPLVTHDNYRLGVLCAIDYKPRTIEEKELNILKALARIVMDEMELRLSARRIFELNEKLKVKATHDALTGLWNREWILSFLDKSHALARREARPLSVIIADIDNFKEINDTYGHQVGDKVLKEVARRMKSAVRESDCLGRFGGEEFLHVLYPCTTEQAKTTAERIRLLVSGKPIKIRDHVPAEIAVTISAGVFGTERHPGIKTKRLVKYADDALYKSKRQGRNRVTINDAGDSPDLS